MITGAAKVAGVVGWPVAHSLSPLIHNAWIDAARLDAAYVPFATPPDRFQGLVDGLRGGVFRGLNVTVPHKQRAFELADEATDAARAAGAANLLLFRTDGRVVADNTDGRGLLAALAEQAPDWRVDAGPVVVLGAGGAAAGAVAALLGAGAPAVRVAARRGEAAGRMCAAWRPTAEAYGFDRLDRALDGASAVINATSAGLGGEGALPDLKGASPDAVFMDMVYSPLRTAFLSDASVRGQVTIDGLAMLIGQARPSFQALFGVAPPATVDVRALCLAALGETP